MHAYFELRILPFSMCIKFARIEQKRALTSVDCSSRHWQVRAFTVRVVGQTFVRQRQKRFIGMDTEVGEIPGERRMS